MAAGGNPESGSTSNKIFPPARILAADVVFVRNRVVLREEGHEEDVHDLVINVMHDIDDVRIYNLVVKERQ